MARGGKAAGASGRKAGSGSQGYGSSLERVDMERMACDKDEQEGILAVPQAVLPLAEARPSHDSVHWQAAAATWRRSASAGHGHQFRAVSMVHRRGSLAVSVSLMVMLAVGF